MNSLMDDDDDADDAVVEQTAEFLITQNACEEKNRCEM